MAFFSSQRVLVLVQLLAVTSTAHASSRGLLNTINGLPKGPVVGVDEIPTVQTGSVDLPSEQSTGNDGRHSFSASGDYIDAAVQEQNDVSTNQPLTEDSASGGATVDGVTVATPQTRRLHQVGPLQPEDLHLDGASTTTDPAGTVDETESGAGSNAAGYPHFAPHAVQATTTQAGQTTDNVGASGTTDCFDSSDATCFKVGK